MGSVTRFAIPLVLFVLCSINDVSYGRHLASPWNNSRSAETFVSAFSYAMAQSGTLSPEQTEDMDVISDIVLTPKEKMARSFNDVSYGSNMTSPWNNLRHAENFFKNFTHGASQSRSWTPQQTSGQQMFSSLNDSRLVESRVANFSRAMVSQSGTSTPEQAEDMDIISDIVLPSMEKMARSGKSSKSMLQASRLVESFEGAFSQAMARCGTLTPEHMEIVSDILLKLMDMMTRSCTSSKSMLKDLNMGFAELLSQEEPV